MASCKDCYYNGVCGHEYRCADWCDDFKDRSRIVELPCKLGDIVQYFSVLTYNTI